MSFKLNMSMDISESSSIFPFCGVRPDSREFECESDSPGECYLNNMLLNPEQPVSVHSSFLLGNYLQ